MSGPDADLQTERRRQAARWLSIAQEDTRVCRLCLANQNPAERTAAYLCQQAAEKLVKGLLVVAGVHFPKTHDMETLGDLAVAHYPAWRQLLLETFRLTDWAWVYRYPGPEDEDDPSLDDLTHALETIEQLTVRLASLVFPDSPGRSTV